MRNRSFIIMTFLSPVIMIALIGVVAYLSQINNDKKRVISILDETGVVGDVFQNNENTTYEFINHTGLETAKELVKAKQNFGLLYVKKSSDTLHLVETVNFYSDESPSVSIISSLERRIEKRLSDIKLQNDGVDIEQIRASKTSVNIDQETFGGEKTSKIDSYLKLAFGGAAGYLLFMFIIIYGNMIMRSVIEEKTSRIIEIIISSVKPVQLMMGKIIGTSLAGVTQFIIWIVLGSVLLFVVSSLFLVNVLGVGSCE